jgi:hypothetical protein
MEIICKKCGERYNKGYKHICKTNEENVRNSLFVGTIKEFIKTNPYRQK